MDEDETRRLLDAVEATSASVQSTHAVLMEQAAARALAVQAAMDAGIPRQRIAEAAGVHRNVLYQILRALK